jgi:cellulose synthase/poly-beta-1,6-N-acetylglucosamine synthase-like glycosyltransferase
VITVPLDAGPSPICLDPSYRAGWLTFTLDGVPLGHRVLDGGEFPLSAEQVWTLATEAVLPALYEFCVRRQEPGSELISGLVGVDPLADFHRQRNGLAAPRLVGQTSIVICTRERSESLRRCLESLSSHAGEIIVVDNAPTTDATRLLVSEFPNVRYVMEPRGGLSHARNRGVRESEGAIIAFTDDDVTVSPSWVAELVRPFENPRVECTTGLVLPAELNTHAQALFENWQSLHRGYEQQMFDSAWLASSRGHMAPVWDIGAGANMAIRRSAFAQHGLFDTRLGAGASGCSEDSEFWDRVLAAGGSCVYTPSCIITTAPTVMACIIRCACTVAAIWRPCSFRQGGGGTPEFCAGFSSICHYTTSTVSFTRYPFRRASLSGWPRRRDIWKDFRTSSSL